jgi:threonylcarbamoyladenosine tRNA methylthiotransferase MtaB
MAAATVKRASVHTLGCRLNQSETALIVERLKAAGYEVVPFGEPADVGIINTCTVTAEADAKSRQLVRSFIRKNPGAYTAVIGCYSQMGYKALAEIEGVDLIVGNQEKLSVVDFVAEGKNAEPLIVRDRIDRDDFSIEVTGAVGALQRANLKIQDGCDFMCSFCIIPFARGRARSRDFENLVKEAKELAARGVREVVLTGVNVGTYAHGGSGIVEVVERLNAIDGIDRIRISSIEPTTVPEELLSFMDDPGHALVPYLHLPLQSGSNRVLGLMKRKYTREEYLDFARLARRRVRDICIGTDVLVGTPGETEADFEETCSALEEGPVDYAHVFKYSERSGTAAARYPDKVGAEEKNRRSVRIRKISAKKRRMFFERHLGRTVDVLFEQQDDGYWSGYTGNYIRVAARSPKQLENAVRPVRLERICGDFVLGNLQDA